MKKCYRCKIDKDENEFALSSTKKDGRQGRCKQCSKEYNLQRRLKNPEQERVKSRQYYADNIEKVRETHNQYYQRHRDNKRKAHKNDPRYEIWMHAKTRAKKYNLAFEITLEDIVIPDLCPILGIKLEVGEGKFHDGSPTLDRLLPERGYVKGNISVISYRANTIKSSGTLEEHEKICEYIKRNTT